MPPANDLIPENATFWPATVRQLLTHTARIGDVVHPSRVLMSGRYAESFRSGRRCPPWRVLPRGSPNGVEPGATFTYIDHGFATLGKIVEEKSSRPLDRYFR
jgi:CubicO group peptidase (beta-lactamase class C family)